MSRPVVLRLALLDVGGAPGACLALFLFIFLRLRLEDERLAGRQGGRVVGLRRQRGVVDRRHGLGLLELLVEAGLALLLRDRGCIGHEAADEAHGSDRVVVGGDDPVHEVGVAVRVGHRHDRDLEAARLADRDRLAMGIHDEHGAGYTTQLADAADGSVGLLISR